MEQKKTSRADLENEKPVFLLMSFVVVLSLLFVVFEWQDQQVEYPDVGVLSNLFVEEPFDVSIEHLDEIGASEETEANMNISEIVVNDEFNPVDELSGVTDSIHLKPIVDVKEEVIKDTVLLLQKSTTDFTSDPDTLPEFPGGRSALLHYIYQTVRYPEVASKQRIQGRIVCSFIVNTDGSISNIELVQSVYVFLDDEALRVIRSMPKWKPGIKNGHGVRVKCYVPIVFKL